MDGATELKVPGLRAHIGDWIYYTTFLRLKDVADRVSFATEIHTSERLRELIQREVEANHAESIKRYLLQQKEHFFNALVIAVYGGSPKWAELSIGVAKKFDLGSLPDYIEGALGILILDGSEKLFAVDGQHRVAGIKKALSEKPELGSEEITVIFVAHGTDQPGLERTIEHYIIQ